MRIKFSSYGFNAKQLRNEKRPNKQAKYKGVAVNKKKIKKKTNMSYYLGKCDVIMFITMVMT